jgi:hypothetical protein
MAREAEATALKQQFDAASPDPLGVFLIPSDGNCLYSAVSHQLHRLKTLPWGLPLGPGQGSIAEWLDDHPLLELAEMPESGLSPGLDALPMTVEALRVVAAEHLAENRHEFEPFLTMESEADDGVSYEQYVERVRSSNEWGRQLELRALADCLEVQILVYAADQEPMPMRAEVAMSPGRSRSLAPVLRVSYHKHQYTLGEHYNSVVPAPEATPSDEAQEAQWAKAGEKKQPSKAEVAAAVSPRSAEMLNAGNSARRSPLQLEKKQTRDFGADMQAAGVAMPRTVVLAKGPEGKGFMMARTRLWTLEVVPAEGTVTVADRLAATSKLRAAALSGDQSQLLAAVAHAEALGLEEEAAVGRAKLAKMGQQPPQPQQQQPQQAGGATPDGWPPSLLKWVERGFARCETPEQREFVDKTLKATVKKAQDAGAVWQIDWNVRPLPPLPAAPEPAQEERAQDPLAMLRAFKQKQQQEEQAAAAAAGAQVDEPLSPTPMQRQVQQQREQQESAQRQQQMQMEAAQQAQMQRVHQMQMQAAAANEVTAAMSKAVAAGDLESLRLCIADCKQLGLQQEAEVGERFLREMHAKQQQQQQAQQQAQQHAQQQQAQQQAQQQQAQQQPSKRKTTAAAMGTDPLSMLRAFKEAEAKKQQEQAQAQQPPQEAAPVESSSATLAKKAMLSGMGAPAPAPAPTPAPAPASAPAPAETAAPPVRKTTAAANGTDALSMLRAYKEKQAAEEEVAAAEPAPPVESAAATLSMKAMLSGMGVQLGADGAPAQAAEEDAEEDSEEDEETSEDEEEDEEPAAAVAPAPAAQPPTKALAAATSSPKSVRVSYTHIHHAVSCPLRVACRRTKPASIHLTPPIVCRCVRAAPTVPVGCLCGRVSPGCVDEAGASIRRASSHAGQACEA